MPATLSRLPVVRGSESRPTSSQLSSKHPLVGRRGRATMCTFQYIRAQMTTTVSVRIDSDTKDQLEALAKRSRRSKSFLAAEAIAAYVEAERWQLDEIQGGLQELEKGRAVAHKDVSKWVRSWGKNGERKAPRA